MAHATTPIDMKSKQKVLLISFLHISYYWIQKNTLIWYQIIQFFSSTPELKTARPSGDVIIFIFGLWATNFLENRPRGQLHRTVVHFYHSWWVIYVTIHV